MKRNLKLNTLFVIQHLILDLINCFKNRVAEIKCKEAFGQLFEKFLNNLDNWVHTTKVYTIYHVALQDQMTSMGIGLQLKQREANLYSYSRNPSSKDYSKELTMHS